MKRRAYIFACLLWTVWTVALFFAVINENTPVQNRTYERAVRTYKKCSVVRMQTGKIVTKTRIERGGGDQIIPYYSAIATNISDEEVDLLAKILYLEAGNQTITGQRAVVEVIFNRVMDDEFPDTIEEVIYQPKQFTTVPYLASAKPNEEQYRAVDLTLKTNIPILEPHVLFFATSIPDWQTKYEKIGAHYFGY